jgi:hypothetical protein
MSMCPNAMEADISLREGLFKRAREPSDYQEVR